ncbi:GTPase, partial [Campylobacter concisus]
MIRALSAKFITSSPSIKEAPSFVTSEVVFLGRSNVGKSSLINALVNQKNLAKSSST